MVLFIIGVFGLWRVTSYIDTLDCGRIQLREREGEAYGCMCILNEVKLNKKVLSLFNKTPTL